jgi:heme/copper-type cytochrome/quinol oxidase subunit 2
VAALALIVPALVLAISPGHGAYADSGPRVVEITAKRFGFTPDQITLKKGETVTLRLHSEDVTHGFFMRKLKIGSEVEAKRPTSQLRRRPLVRLRPFAITSVGPITVT